MIAKLAASEQAFKDLGFAGEKLKAALAPAISWLAGQLTLLAGNLGWMLNRIDTASQHGQVIEMNNLKKQLISMRDLLAQPKTKMESIAEFIGIGTTFEERVALAKKQIASLEKRIMDMRTSWMTGENARVEIINEGAKKAVAITQAELDKRLDAEAKFLEDRKALEQQAASVAKEWGIPTQVGAKVEIDKLTDDFNKLIMAGIGGSALEEARKVYEAKLKAISDTWSQAMVDAADIDWGNQGQVNYWQSRIYDPAMVAVTDMVTDAKTKMTGLFDSMKPPPVDIFVDYVDVDQATVSAIGLGKVLEQITSRPYKVSVEVSYITRGTPQGPYVEGTPEYSETTPPAPEPSFSGGPSSVSKMDSDLAALWQKNKSKLKKMIRG
jgi:hypothetical protein